MCGYKKKQAVKLYVREKNKKDRKRERGLEETFSPRRLKIGVGEIGRYKGVGNPEKGESSKAG